MIRPLLALALLLSSQVAGIAAKPLDGITFSTEPGKIYLPFDEATKHLSWRGGSVKKNGEVRLGLRAVPSKSLRQLTDGTRLVTLADLESLGASVRLGDDGASAEVSKGLRRFAIAVGAKRIEVSLAEQRLRAWQGERLVLDSRISSGRRGGTPSGSFTAGPYKARRHYSSLFDNAPMPWSVQVTGHIFIHGFTSVPNYPASHGCIRLPLKWVEGKYDNRQLR